MPRPWPVEGIDATTSATVAAPKILAVRLAELAHHRDRTLHQRDAESVHDLRVATRRLRAALRLFGGALGKATPAVKALGDALGRVRDLDVQIEWLERARERVAVDERPGIDWLLGDRRAALPPLELAMQNAIRRFHDHLEPVLTLHLHVAGFAKPLGARSVRKRIARRLRKLGESIDELTAVEDARAVHALRVAGKKARYDLELVDGIYGAAASTALERLKTLQEAIGELHDRDVRLTLLPEWVARSHRLEQPGVVRLLKDTLDERKRLGGELAEEIEAWRADDEARFHAKAIIAG